MSTEAKSALDPFAQASTASRDDLRWVVEVNLFEANWATQGCAQVMRSGRSLGRIATRRAIDAVAMVLAGAASSYTTGSTIAVDGGPSGP